MEKGLFSPGIKEPIKSNERLNERVYMKVRDTREDNSEGRVPDKSFDGMDLERLFFGHFSTSSLSRQSSDFCRD